MSFQGLWYTFVILILQKQKKSRVQSQSRLYHETSSQINKKVNSLNAMLNATEAKGEFQLKITVFSNMFEKTLEFVGVMV